MFPTAETASNILLWPYRQHLRHMTSGSTCSAKLLYHTPEMNTVSMTRLHVRCHPPVNRSRNNTLSGISLSRWQRTDYAPCRWTRAPWPTRICRCPTKSLGLVWLDIGNLSLYSELFPSLWFSHYCLLVSLSRQGLLRLACPHCEIRPLFFPSAVA